MTAVREPGVVHGVNVIGHLTSSAGLGNTTRIFIDLLRSKGHAVAGFDIEAYAQEVQPCLAEGMTIGDIRHLPFDHNLIIASIDRLPQLWLRHAPNLLEPRFRNAGLLFWELPVIPPAWVPALKMFDVILTCSQYVRQAFESAVPEVPTLHAEHPLRSEVVDIDPVAERLKFGIPLESTAFCCSFDPRSGFTRKNPLGAIKAWLQAFPARPDVCLVVKSNGPPVSDDAEVSEILGHVERDPRIVWLPHRLEHSEVMALFACCDIFVSLHRSEGLGLVPMEAMSLGKLVIATGYSGNMTFMTEQNSLHVPYRLVEPLNDRSFLTRGFAGSNASWAEPNLEQAASLMRMAADDPARAKALGQRARFDIRGRQQTAWEGHFLGHMTRLLNASNRHPLRAGLRRSVLWTEFTNPTLVRKNAAALFRHRKLQANA